MLRKEARRGASRRPCQPPGPRDYDPFRDEPDPNVLLAMEKVYRELPLWGLNGWNQEEVRQQMFERA